MAQVRGVKSYVMGKMVRAGYICSKPLGELSNVGLDDNHAHGAL